MKRQITEWRWLHAIEPAVALRVIVSPLHRWGTHETRLIRLRERRDIVEGMRVMAGKPASEGRCPGAPTSMQGIALHDVPQAFPVLHCR